MPPKMPAIRSSAPATIRKASHARQASCHQAEGGSEIEQRARAEREVAGDPEQAQADPAVFRGRHEFGLGQLDLVLHQQLHISR